MTAYKCPARYKFGTRQTKIGYVVVKPRPNIKGDIMTDEGTEYVLDTSGLQKSIDDKFADISKKIEEMLTPKEEVSSITESKIAPEDTVFDYRVGVAKWLNNEMDSRRASLREETGKYVKSTPSTSKLDSEKALKDIFSIKESLTDHGKATEYVLKGNSKLVEAIGSVNPDCCIPEVWADDVERTHIYPGSVFWGAWFLRWERGIQGQPGDKVWICTVGTAVATTIAAECTEPTTTGATISCKSITLTDYACAFYMCKNDIESVQPDLITELNAGLGSCLERQIDNYFFDVARTNGCTGGTLTSSSALSGSLIAEGMGSMRNGNQRKWRKLISIFKRILHFADRSLRTSCTDYAPCAHVKPATRLKLRLRVPLWQPRRYHRRKGVGMAEPPDSHGSQGDSEHWFGFIRQLAAGEERVGCRGEARSQNRV